MKRFGFRVVLVALAMMLVGGLAAADRGGDQANPSEASEKSAAAEEVLQLRELIKKLEGQVSTLEERVADLERGKGLAHYLRFGPDVFVSPEMLDSEQFHIEYFNPFAVPEILEPRQFRIERFEPQRGPDRGVKRRINGFEFYFQPVEKTSSPAPRDGRHRNR